LNVESSRVERWYKRGLLLIGDAAHVMSPVAGVRINVAVQDAVAAANLLTEPLRRGAVTDRDLAAVQKQREPAVRLVQRIQRLIQDRIAAPGLGRRAPIPAAMVAVAAHVHPRAAEHPGPDAGIWPRPRAAPGTATPHVEPRKALMPRSALHFPDRS
jgi:2-polyprenyl-6-methoxyphenol hydroxylase-like FAD-dependent oxidoreductase